MSSTNVKRSRASDKDKKPRSGARSKKDASKPRRKATGKSGDAGTKKRRSATVGKKEGRKSSKSASAKPSNKRARASPVEESEAKAVKISARKIEVPWKPRAKWAVRTQPFRRLVNHYAHEKIPEMRMAQFVAKAIQSAVEEQMVEIMRQASMMALHAKRTTVNSHDVSLQSRLSKPMDGSDAEYLATSVLAKRVAKRDQAPRTASQKKPKKEKAAGDSKAPAVAAAEASAAGGVAAPAAAAGGEKKAASKGVKKGKAKAVAAGGNDSGAAATMTHEVLPPLGIATA